MEFFAGVIATLITGYVVYIIRKKRAERDLIKPQATYRPDPRPKDFADEP